MKKIVFAALASSLFAVAAMAQTGTSIIVSAGYQGANISTSSNNKAKMNSAFRAGAAVDFTVLDAGTMELSIQPGLYYSVKGAKSDLSVSSLGYLELPVLANLRFGVTPSMNVFLNAGPYLAYGVNSWGKTDTGSKKLNELGDAFAGDYFKSLFKNVYKPFDAGIQVGAGVEYNRIQLGVGTQFGFVNINKSSNDTKLTNNTFFVSVGYRF